MLNKKLQQTIYGFMALLMLLNSMTPLKVFAEGINEPSLFLEKVTAGQKDQSLDIRITINELNEDAKITASQPAIQQAIFEQNDQSTNLAVENNQIISVPKNNTGTGIIHLILNEVDKLSSIDLNYENQTISYQFDRSEESSKSSDENPNNIESSVSELSSEQQSSVSNTETSSSTYETKNSEKETSEESIKPVKEVDVKEKAAGPTDIRTYFPNGTGTIVTDSKLIFLDDKGNVIEPPITPDSTVRISYNWQIPEDIRQQIQPGDYFDFKLPDELKPNRVLSGELKNDEGEVYATYAIDLDGNIRFTFTEEVQNQSNIEGRFRFDTTIKKEHIDGPGDITIHYPIEDDLPPVDVEIRPNTDQSIDKKGQFDRTPNPKQVEWTVDFNQAMNHLVEATITEKWPAGIAFKTAKIMELVMNLDGTVKETGRELSSNEYTVDTKGNIKILGETNKAYRIIYQTTINDSIKPENGGKISFTNMAKLTDKNNKDGIDAKATVTTNYGKPIEKNIVGYDSAKQEFSWAVKYNYNEKKIVKKDAVLIDTISKNMDLVDQSVKVYPVTFNEQGNELKGAPLVEGTDYVLEPNPSGNGFVVRFLKDVDQAVRVEYKTKVNGIVTDPTQVNNSVSNGTGESGGDTGTAQQQNVIKSISDIDYSTKEVGWRISINKNNYEMNNLILKDRYSPTPSLSMVEDEDGNYDFTIRDVTKNKLLTQGVDYDLTLVKDNLGNELGFNVVFKNDYKKTNSEFEITYHTYFDVSLLDPTNPNKDRFKNSMAADWTDEYGKKHDSKDDQDFRPVDPYQLNAQKSGKYNAQNKHITWTIAVNHSRNSLTNAQLTDPIKENQAYVKGSVKVYEAIVKKDGTVVKKQPETLVTDEMKRLEEPSSGNNQTLSIDFPEGAKQTYLIEFETSLEGKIIEASKQYTNKAQYENNNDKRDVIGEVGVRNGGKYVQKSGAQNKQNPDYVDWKAVINPAQSTLKNVVIKDQPTENQVIEVSSIKLYETTIAVNGTITPNYERPLAVNEDYTVELSTDNITGKQTLIIKLLKEIKTSYQLEYSSYITSSVSGNKDKVSNKITVTGDNDKVVSGGEGKDVTVEIHHSGGSATGKKGKLTIQKTEADSKTKLTGAHFQLWNTSKTQLLREGKVNNDGQIVFGNLPYGEYLLIETDAPEGFTISDELAAGRRITINDQTSVTSAVPLTIPNERNKVILQKTDEQGNPIKFGGAIQKGARFKLEYYNRLAPEGALWKEVSLNPDRVDVKGILEINSLPLGSYRITEVEAPAGYLLNSDSTYFQVFRNSDHQVPTVNLEFKNYQGEAELIKKDSEDSPLRGAEFNVIDSNGNKVNQQPLVSQADGKVIVSGLSPGKYKFVETKAPKGYVVNSKEVPFSIRDEESGKPDLVTTQVDGSALELTNYQGSAEFIKKNKEGDRLEGAEFDLLNAQGQKMNRQPIVSDKTGMVHVEHLAPGKYSFVEMKAPNGYLINEERLTFTIKDSVNGPVPVTELSNFINYQGSFEIVKRNTDFDGLAGAEFTLYDQDKKALGKTVGSDSEGRITFDHLAPGSYYFQETKAPKVTEGADYVVNPALIKVEIPDKTEGETKQIELGDFQNFRGKAQITKVGDGGPIAGAEFRLSRIVDGNEQFVKTVVAPENGVLDISGLGAGSYKLQETKAAPGYIINEQPIYFVVQENDDKNPTIDNLDFENYQVEITGEKIDENNKALTGAEYQILEADNQNGSPIKVIDRKGKETDTIVTDEDGGIYFKGLDQGHYVMIETKAPKGYILDTTPHPFEIKAYLGKPEKIKLGSFVNYQGDVSIIKKDEGGQLLKNAKFEIRDLDGNLQTVTDGEGNETETVVSGSDGKIIASGLAPGNYELIEIQAPDGYLLNKKVIPFEIVKSNAGKPETITLTDFINYQGSVKMRKVSDSGQGLADAVFELHKEDGTAVDKYRTDKKGLLSINHLMPGKYYVTEIKAPTGYLINTKKVNFTISEESTDKPEIITLPDFVNYQASVKMRKVSEIGKALPEAVFELYTEYGAAVAKYTTDKEGLLNIDHLAPGKYYLTEVKAPTGYIINTRRISFAISGKNKGKPEKITLDDFVNYQGSVKMKKISETGQGLANATFELHKEDGALIDSYTTDKSGQLTIDYLEPGKYFFIEIKAPIGYVLGNEKRTFEISASAKDKPKTIDAGKFVNKTIVKPKGKTKQPPKPRGKKLVHETKTTTGSYPQTNDSNSPWLLIIGVITLALTGWLYFKNKLTKLFK